MLSQTQLVPPTEEDNTVELTYTFNSLFGDVQKHVLVPSATDLGCSDNVGFDSFNKLFWWCKYSVYFTNYLDSRTKTLNTILNNLLIGVISSHQLIN